MFGGKHLICLIELRLKEICGLDTKTEHKFYMPCQFKQIQITKIQRVGKSILSPFIFIKLNV